jgi:chromosome partitioning protein
MVISIASQKGGVGKTTTSISIAAGLARRNKRILLIDIDSQANSSKVLLPHYEQLRPEDTLYRTILGRQPLAIHPTTLSTLDIVPAHILLSNTDIELTGAKDHREARLKRELDMVKDRYDHVFIDCPPALSWLTINAFTASDAVIVIVAPGYFELDSIVQISKTIEEVREFFNPNLELLGLLFTMSDPTLNSKISITVLRQNYPASLLKTIIPKNTDVRDAHFHRQDIFGYNAASKSAEAYDRLIDELNL